MSKVGQASAYIVPVGVKLADQYVVCWCMEASKMKCFWQTF